MKNIQVIDGATNCTYSIYALTDEEFTTIFPGSGQNIEFIEDVRQRLDPATLAKTFANVWKRPVKKSEANGIHGTLFYELSDKKPLYPSKSEQDIEGPPHSPAQSA